MVEQQEGHPKSDVIPACDHGSTEDNSVCLDSDSDSFNDPTQKHIDSKGDTRRTVNDNEMKQIESLARSETNFLRIWRLVLLLFILGTCAAATTGAFLFIRNEQTRAINGSVSFKSLTKNHMLFSYPSRSLYIP